LPEYILELRENERKFAVKEYHEFVRRDGKIIGHLGGNFSGRKTAIRILRVEPSPNWNQLVGKKLTVPVVIREFIKRDVNGCARYDSPIDRGEFKLNDLQIVKVA